VAAARTGFGLAGLTGSDVLSPRSVRTLLLAQEPPGVKMLGKTYESSPARRRASDDIHTVTGGTFKRLVLDGEGPIAVEFMSYGCAYCRELEPVLEEVAAALRTKEAVFRVNVAVEQDLARAYEIEGTPTFVMFLNGSEVGRAAGPHPTASNVRQALTSPFER
jgi:thioredoxin 1